MVSSNFSNSTLFPQNIEERIGFDKIKELIKNECIFNIGVENLEKTSFQTSIEKIETLLKQTEEFIDIYLYAKNFNPNHFVDFREDLSRLYTQGTFIEPEVLANLILTLESIKNILEFFKNTDNEKYPLLKKISQNYSFDYSIINYAKRIVDSDGLVKDNASDALFEIRKTIKDLTYSRDRKLNAIYSSLTKSGVAAETGITIRNGRWVIPVIASHKRQVKGVVHDESATGQTVYIEPADILMMNNDIISAISKEKKEIIRIMTAYTDELRYHLDDILPCFNYLGIIDYTRAKAKFAITINGLVPFLKDEALIDWKEAYHPLLFLKNKDIKKITVPHHITLNETIKILIISGPNAGGKSVCLKTVGLLQYMLQCGIPIPVKDNSTAGIFHKLFIDIGDQQSLENDLSTYSSHLNNMTHFVNHADKKTLFLIDEMGAGTEPQIGGAIAEAVLEKLYANQSMGVITTHYLNLKMLPQSHSLMRNAAMLFDRKNLNPLFELSIGEPGSSFAFEIAFNMGLPKDIIKNAQSKIDEAIVDFETYYLQVKEKEAYLNKRLKEIDVSDTLLNETFEKYNTLLKDLEAQKQAYILQAKFEAQELLTQANRKIEHVIKQIKENQADKEKTILLRKEIEVLKNDIKPTLSESIIKENDTLNSSSKKKKKTSQNKVALPYQIDLSDKPLAINDYVLIEGQNEVGQIDDINDRYAFVTCGHIRLKVTLLKLKRISNYMPKKQFARSQYEQLDISNKQKNFKTDLDIRGKRVEEAMHIVETFLNDAVLLNIGKVRILHGKGDGILRRVIQNDLRSHSLVEKVYDEHIDFGGQGITVVELG